MVWLPLAIIVAILMSAQDILSKKALKKVDAYVVTWAWWFFSLPFLYVAVIFFTGPELSRGFVEIIVINTLLLTCGVISYIKAIQLSDLSLTVPLLNFTPLFLLLTSPVMLGEFPRPIGVLGIIMIVAGAYVLFHQNNKYGWLAPLQNLRRERGAKYMLLVALLFSFTANLDKLGVQFSSPFTYILVINSTLSIMLTVIMVKKTKNIRSQIQSNIILLSGIGLCNALALVTQMSAIEMTQVPNLIAVKRTSVVLTSLYGFLILKERNFMQRMVGIIIMISGVFLIAVS